MSNIAPIYYSLVIVYFDKTISGRRVGAVLISVGMLLFCLDFAFIIVC